MNIFVLDENPEVAASYHCDKHVVKMPTESTQLICSNLNILGIKTVYKTTHVNHPCTIWTRTNRSNFMWVITIGLALCEEYTRRYKRRHKCMDILLENKGYAHLFPVGELTPFVQCMPDEYKREDPVEAYREFYIKKKRPFAFWKYSQIPEWFRLATVSPSNVIPADLTV